ncbi:MAG: DUF5916 domain-containing protein [Candidatus Zixiibacteriota bacterium]
MVHSCKHWSRSVCVSLVGTSLILATAVSATTTSPLVFNPKLETRKLASEIKIDGKLDDTGWYSAGRAAGFVERYPGNNAPPPVRTEALITYDDSKLYVAFACLDDPGHIRATMAQRDQYYGDDEVIFCLDTYGDAAWAYEFQVNPYGIQKDFLWTKVLGENRGFDLIWESAAHINDSGYTVEMAIPFASLRFPNKDIQSWRVDFQRGHPRETTRFYSWSPNTYDEQCWPCQWGTVEGITGVRPGKGLEILPSFVSTQAGELAGMRELSTSQINPDTSFQNGDILGELSIGAKYSVNSDVTIEGTYNPDFSQVEADAAQVDVNSTVSLFYPERRPFFQEGSDLFITLFNSFYTRMVNDPDVAAKVTARWNRFSLAYTMAHDENSPYSIPVEERGWTPVIGKSTVNVVRGLGNVGSGSTLGFLVSHRGYEHDGAGSILAGDMEIKLSRSYTVVGQGVISHTREPKITDPVQIEKLALPSGSMFDNNKYTVDLDGEKYWGTAFISQFRRRARHWNFTINYDQLTPTYRTQVGYDPWNDQKTFFAFTTYNFRPTSGIFERIGPQIGVSRRWSFGAGDEEVVRKWARFNTNVSANLRWAQTYIEMGTEQGSQRWFGHEYDKLFTARLTVFSQPHSKLGYNFTYRYGQGPAVFANAKGNETGVNAGLDLKPIDRLVVEPSFNYSRSKHTDTHDVLFEETILRSRFRFQVNPRLSLRLVVQYDDYDVNVFVGAPAYYHISGRTWEFDPLLTYRINSFSMFYFGSTHDLLDFGVPTDGFDLPDSAPSQWRQSSRQFFMKLQYLFQI